MSLAPVIILRGRLVSRRLLTLTICKQSILGCGVCIIPENHVRNLRKGYSLDGREQPDRRLHCL